MNGLAPACELPRRYDGRATGEHVGLEMRVVTSASDDKIQERREMSMVNRDRNANRSRDSPDEDVSSCAQATIAIISSTCAPRAASTEVVTRERASAWPMPFVKIRQAISWGIAVRATRCPCSAAASRQPEAPRWSHQLPPQSPVTSKRTVSPGGASSARYA